MLPKTDFVNAPRMADLAAWAAACGLDTFQAAYAANRQNAIEVLLEHDLLAQECDGDLAKQRLGRDRGAITLDAVGPPTKIANPKVLSDELRTNNADAANSGHRRHARADGRSTCNQDHSAAMTHVTHMLQEAGSSASRRGHGAAIKWRSSVLC